MIKTLVAGLIVALALTMAGCQTLSSDSDQHVRQYSRIADINRRMLAEDIDSLLLLDSPSSLSQWHVIEQ